MGRRTPGITTAMIEKYTAYLKENERSAATVARYAHALRALYAFAADVPLTKAALVAAEKVFPHNLRHLFLRLFYTASRDLTRLADILGHTNLATTRIYTAESGIAHARQMERLGLVIT